MWNVDWRGWVDAVTYLAVRTNPHLRPSREYLEEIIEGAVIVGLSSEWMKRLQAA